MRNEVERKTIADLEMALDCARHNLFQFWSQRPPVYRRMPSELKKNISLWANEVRTLHGRLCDMSSEHWSKDRARLQNLNETRYSRWQKESAEFLAKRGSA